MKSDGVGGRLLLVDGCGGDFRRAQRERTSSRGKIWVCEEQKAKLASLGVWLLGLARVTNQIREDPAEAGPVFQQ
jgi:hypothetical protein